MPVSVEIRYQIDASKIDASDKDRPTTLPAEAVLAQRTNVSFTCDNPACTKNFGGIPRALKWQPEAVEEGTGEIPDDAFRIVDISFFSGRKLSLCSRACAIRMLQTLPVARSPREQNSNLLTMPATDQAVTVFRA